MCQSTSIPVAQGLTKPGGFFVRVYDCVWLCMSASAIMWVQQEVVLRSHGEWFQVPGPVYCHKFQNGDYLLQK